MNRLFPPGIISIPREVCCLGPSDTLMQGIELHMRMLTSTADGDYNSFTFRFLRCSSSSAAMLELRGDDDR